MKRNRVLVTILMSLAAVCASAAEPARPADKNELTIPGDATKNADGTFTWTDKAGKTWIYSKGQFGVSRTLVPKPSTALPQGIPAGSKLNADGTYAFTDKDGKSWTYVITPFGPSRSPGTAAPVAAAPAETAPQQNPNLAVKVIDKGDTFRFERPGPIGSSVWEKKKTELNDEERRLVELSKAKQ